MKIPSSKLIVNKHVQSPEHIEKWGSSKNHENFFASKPQMTNATIKGRVQVPITITTT